MRGLPPVAVSVQPRGSRGLAPECLFKEHVPFALPKVLSKVNGQLDMRLPEEAPNEGPLDDESGNLPELIVLPDRITRTRQQTAAQRALRGVSVMSFPRERCSQWGHGPEDTGEGRSTTGGRAQSSLRRTEDCEPFRPRPFGTWAVEEFGGPSKERWPPENCRILKLGLDGGAVAARETPNWEV